MQEINKLQIGEAVKKEGNRILTNKKSIDKKIKKYKGSIVNKYKLVELSPQSKKTENCLKLLFEAFARGCTNREASTYAGITEQTLYGWIRQDPQLFRNIEQIKDNPKLMSRFNITDSIARGNIEDSKWYLTKKAKDEFGEPEIQPLGATTFKHLQKVIKTEADETTIDERTISFVSNLKTNGQLN